MSHTDPRNIGLPRARTRPAGADRDVRVVALMFAYNEGDVIRHAIGGLIEEGCEVYLLDNCSTDDTVEQASHWLGKGLIDIERFPAEGRGLDRAEHVFSADDIMRRCEELGVELGADWYVLTGADEFRESPWPDLNLAEGIAYADSLGFNAIQYEAIVFRPVDDDFPHGGDVREHLVHWEPATTDSVLCVSTWKAGPYRADLVTHGGHVVRFPDRKVFPIPFIHRHYQLRGITHGRRKIFQDRMPRFAQEERDRGWHVHYDAYVEGARQFLWNPDTLTVWDPNAFRAQLLARYSRDAAFLSSLAGFEPATMPLNGDRLNTWLKRSLRLGHDVPVAEIQECFRTIGAVLPLQQTGRSVPPVPAIPAEVMARLLDVLVAQRHHDGEMMDEHHLVALRTLLDHDAATAALGLEARGTTVVVLAEELQRHPELLQAYVAAVGAADDATLVIYAPDGDPEELAGRLEPVLEAAGAADEDAPDMLLLAIEGGRETLLARAATATLGTTPLAGPLGDVQRFDLSSVRELHARMPLPRTEAGFADRLAA